MIWTYYSSLILFYGVELTEVCFRQEGSGLGLCHGTTKKRVWASHAATKFALILEYLSEGKLHFTGVCLLIK
jgi:uncharacterized BrkB/YihY/UPF0761 family membrane protein